MSGQSIIDHYLPKITDTARKGGYYGDGTPLTEAELERFAQACAKASDNAPLRLAHYCEVLQYSQLANNRFYSTLMRFLVWLSEQPKGVEQNPEWGMLPDRAQRILTAYAELFPNTVYKPVVNDVSTVKRIVLTEEGYLRCGGQRLMNHITSEIHDRRYRSFYMDVWTWLDSNIAGCCSEYTISDEEISQAIAYSKSNHSNNPVKVW